LELALKTGKRVFAPRVTGQGELRFHRVLSAAGPWAEGPFGIREPPAEPPPDGDPAAGSPGAEPVMGEALGPTHFPVLVIVPGLAFDTQGHRLGRGGGYYDRFLASPEFQGMPEATGSTDSVPIRSSRAVGKAVGLCMPLQLLPEIPTEPWDKTVDALCTGERFFKIPRS
jgi:5-formyltetrahydrofolate cyclo-ligase